MLQLHSFFQSRMVLPRDVAVPVFGNAAPGKRVLLECAGHQAETLSNQKGEFRMWLPPLKAGGPFTLRAWLPESKEEVLLGDVLVGELWLASGQSNMAMTLTACEHFARDAIQAADHPEIRLFTVEKTARLTAESDISGSWQICSPETVSDFSAVAYAFADTLKKDLQVPVGMVTSAWGGTFIEAWMSLQGLARIPKFRDWDAEYRVEVHQPQWWELYRQDANDLGLILSRLPEDEGNRGETEGWAAPDFDDRDWAEINLPGKWNDQGYPEPGVFWFRKTVEIPPAWRGKALTLELGAVDKIDISYANGRQIGQTGRGHEVSHWNKARRYQVPPGINDADRLTLAIRVVSFMHHGGVGGKAEEMKIVVEELGEALPLAGSWRCCREQNYGMVDSTPLMGHGNHNSPHILFDNMIRPLIPIPFKGVIWYQGESNASRAGEYGELLRGLIEDWRWHFARPDLAFYFVQLPEYQASQSYQPESNWALIREAQRRTAGLDNVGMAVTLGLGDSEDIHPKNKIPVGERLARAALAGTYGRDLLAGGPMISAFEKKAEKVICKFDHAGEGLFCPGGGEPEGFYLAEAAGEFYPAVARIVAVDQVEVSAARIQNPCKIRYAWADNPRINFLMNSESLPASPFGTDF